MGTAISPSAAWGIGLATVISEGQALDTWFPSGYLGLGLARDHRGRTTETIASITDGQSVKTSTNVPLSTQGTDAGIKIVGRRRGIITDTL